MKLDERLVERARVAGGHRTAKAAVIAALRAYIRHRKQLGVLDLVGQIDFDPAYDYKAARRKR